MQDYRIKNKLKDYVTRIVILISVACVNVAVAIPPSTDGIKVYHKNAAVADDLDRYQNADNFWDVLRDEFSLPHYEDNPLVQEKIEWFMNNQGFLLRSAARAAPYLYYISQQVKKRHLPAELVLLPIIESGYNPFSLSNVGAAGIWQLMPGTASDFGIKRNNWYDGRRDVIVSTRGALNYLAYLQRFFEGHWLLAIAAYNTGEGNVMNALRRNIQDGKDTDFWSLPLAQQTKDYVPSLLALAVIISHPDQYPIPFPPVQNAPYLAQVDVSTQINMKYAASLAGITYDRISQLNPGINARTTAGKAPSKLVIPIENVEQFTKNVAMLPNSPRLMLTSLARKIKSTTAIAAHYVLQPGDTIYMVRMKDTIDKISKRFHVRKDALVQANALQNKQITPGKQLIIPTHQTPVTASASPSKIVRSGDTVYMVRRGDTIDSIASRYKTTASVIRLTNLIDDSSLMEGQRIVIPTKLRG